MASTLHTHRDPSQGQRTGILVELQICLPPQLPACWVVVRTAQLQVIFAFVCLCPSTPFCTCLQVDFLPTYAAELAVWPLFQAVNFSQVPVRHQLLAVNTFSLLDAAFISWCGNQQDWFGKIMHRLGMADNRSKQD